MKLFLKIPNCWSVLGNGFFCTSLKSQAGQDMGLLADCCSLGIGYSGKNRTLKKGCISIILCSCCNLNAWGFCSNHFYNMLSIPCSSYYKLGLNSIIVVALLQKWWWSSMRQMFKISLMEENGKVVYKTFQLSNLPTMQFSSVVWKYLLQIDKVTEYADVLFPLRAPTSFGIRL